MQCHRVTVTMKPPDQPVGIIAVEDKPVRHNHVLKEGPNKHWSLYRKASREQIVNPLERIAGAYERPMHNLLEWRVERELVPLGELDQRLSGDEGRRLLIGHGPDDGSRRKPLKLSAR